MCESVEIEVMRDLLRVRLLGQPRSKAPVPLRTAAVKQHPEARFEKTDPNDEDDAKDGDDDVDDDATDDDVRICQDMSRYVKIYIS